MKRCSPAALVGVDVELPTDLGIANEGYPPRVGCSHLVCGDCGAKVRHADARAVPSNYPPSKNVVEAIYASSEPARPHSDTVTADSAQASATLRYLPSRLPISPTTSWIEPWVMA